MASAVAGAVPGVRPPAAAWSPVEWVLAGSCAVVLAVKFWLIARLNINWDEFLYLSHVHSAVRGDLTQGLQTTYTHLFGWLARLPGDEIMQMHVARAVTVALLGASAWLLQRLAARWFSPPAALVAALVFLSMWPTLKHGGSFRADSLLLPLQLAALLALTRSDSTDHRRGLEAGILLGVATAVSIKAILLAPVVLILGFAGRGGWRDGMRRLAWLAGAALATASVLIGAHLLSIPAGNAVASSGSIAGGAWQQTLRDAPWLPQAATLQEMFAEDVIIWLTAVAGFAWVVSRRMWGAAACASALLPILFYRNSYAYYYVVMWGTASVTIAAAIDGARDLAGRRSRPAIISAVTLALAAMTAGQGLRDLPFLSHPRQEPQRQLVAAVHAIFPEPVAYVDHSGMIASYRKVNFFMSTWGVETYVRRGQPFMPRAIERHRPPLLISNRPELIPGAEAYARLLEEDRRIIESGYQPYWGQIRIAGAAATLGAGGPARLELPFGGNYRLDSPVPVYIDGRLSNPGEVIRVNDGRLALELRADPIEVSVEPQIVRLLWADARSPPDELPVSLTYFDPL